MKRINSRAKGIRGELDVRDLLRKYGYEAHRGQQHSGGPASPDVIHNIPGMHIEAKLVNGGNLYRWLEQAIQDAGDLIPVVFHRMDRREWVVIIRAEDFLRTYAPPPSGGW